MQRGHMGLGFSCLKQCVPISNNSSKLTKRSNNDREDRVMQTPEEINERKAKTKKKYAETLVVHTFDEQDREYPKTDMGNAQQLAERYKCYRLCELV
jgi:hypothetical protein